MGANSHRRPRSPVDQVDDILKLNARVLAMNETLLDAILKNGAVREVTMAPINIDEIIRHHK